MKDNSDFQSYSVFVSAGCEELIHKFIWQWSPLESQISIALLGALAQVTANVIIILIQFAYFNKYKLVVRASVREQWAKWRRWKDHNCHLANFKRLSCFLDFAEKLMTGLKKRSFIKWSTKCFFFFVVCTIYFRAENTDRTNCWQLHCSYTFDQLEQLHQTAEQNDNKRKHGDQSCFMNRMYWWK